MKTVKTIKPIDFSKTVVISFDITTISELHDISFGVGYSGGKLIFNNINNISEIDEDITISDSIIEYSVYKDVDLIDNLKIISLNENTMPSKKEFFLDGDVIFYDEEKTIKLEDNIAIYEETEDYSNPSDLIVEDEKVYKPSEKYDITSYVLKGEDETSDYIFIVDDIGEDISILSVDTTISRDISKYSFYETYHECVEKDGEIRKTSHLSNGNIFDEENVRFRFVFTNGGRLLNVSTYDRKNKMYIPHSSHSFINYKEEDNLFVYSNSLNTISNVSTNF